MASCIQPVSSMASEPKKMIILKSSDGEEFEVEAEVAMESQTIRHMIEDGCAENRIPVPNVNGKILSMVIQYCRKHVESSNIDGDHIKTWDAAFVKFDQVVLYDVLLAANYLNIKGLLDLSCQAAADMMRGKSEEEIRKIFNIKKDFSPEEEEEIESEQKWAGLT